MDSRQNASAPTALLETCHASFITGAVGDCACLAGTEDAAFLDCVVQHGISLQTKFGLHTSVKMA